MIKKKKTLNSDVPVKNKVLNSNMREKKNPTPDHDLSNRLLLKCCDFPRHIYFKYLELRAVPKTSS